MPIVKIVNRCAEDINWLSGQACAFQLADYTHLWVIAIDRNERRLDEYWQLLNADEKKRALRYVQIKDKNRFIISRGVLRILLGRYLNIHPASIDFSLSANKKPFVKNCPFSYNISHSGNRVAIALSPADVGVDVEQIDPSFDYSGIVDNYFSTDENRYIAERDSIFRFFLLWTRKEALTKATEKGLDDDLKHIPSLDGAHEPDATLTGSTDDLLVTSLLHGSDHLVSLVTREKFSNIKFLDWDL